MECEEVGLMLEAYALGAVAPEEGAHIEEHLGECLACWDHLSQSQRAAALLALAVPLEEPREDLRRRSLAPGPRGGARRSFCLSSASWAMRAGSRPSSAGRSRADSSPAVSWRRRRPRVLIWSTAPLRATLSSQVTKRPRWGT